MEISSFDEFTTAQQLHGDIIEITVASPRITDHFIVKRKPPYSGAGAACSMASMTSWNYSTSRARRRATISLRRPNPSRFSIMRRCCFQIR